MTTELQKLGKKGEEIATDLYLKQNFTLLETNWHYGHLEIDVIVQNENTIVFCEVKTRTSTIMGEPENFVTIQKQRNLIKAANHYVLTKRIEKEVRFDIMAIVISGERHRIHHIADAFTPKW